MVSTKQSVSVQNLCWLCVSCLREFIVFSLLQSCSMCVYQFSMQCARNRRKNTERQFYCHTRCATFGGEGRIFCLKLFVHIIVVVVVVVVIRVDINRNVGSFYVGAFRNKNEDGAVVAIFVVCIKKTAKNRKFNTHNSVSAQTRKREEYRNSIKFALCALISIRMHTSEKNSSLSLSLSVFKLVVEPEFPTTPPHCK